MCLSGRHILTGTSFCLGLFIVCKRKQAKPVLSYYWSRTRSKNKWKGSGEVKNSLIPIVLCLSLLETVWWVFSWARDLFSASGEKSRIVKWNPPEILWITLFALFILECEVYRKFSNGDGWLFSCVVFRVLTVSFWVSHKYKSFVINTNICVKMHIIFVLSVFNVLCLAQFLYSVILYMDSQMLELSYIWHMT